MRAFSAGAGPLRLCLAVLLLALGVWVVAARADDPAKPAPGDKPKEEAKPAGKLYTFAMDNKPWTQVIEWFADNSELAFAGDFKPTGSFTFVPPKGKQYTIPEIVDILNEALLANTQTQKYILIRRTQTFTFFPADQKIPSEMIRSVSVEDLPKLGKTEVVKLTHELQRGNAEDIAPTLKKLMSPFGEVTPIDVVNHLILQDTADSMRGVLEALKKIEKGEGTDKLTHPCEYLRARDAATTLEKLLGTPPAPPPDPRFPAFGGFGGVPPAPAKPAGKSREFKVDANEDTNTVIATGPADKIAQAKGILADLEKQAKDSGAKKVVAGSRYTIEVIKLGTLDPDLAAATLKGMFGDSAKTPTAAFIEAQPGRNAIAVKGTDAQINEIKAAVKAMDEGGGAMRVITIDKGSGAAVAEEVKRLLKEMGKDVQIVNPGELIDPKKPEKPEKIEKPKEGPPGKPGGVGRLEDALRRGTLLAQAGRGAPPGDEKKEPAKDEKKEPAKEEKKDGKITIIPSGNRITVISDDPEVQRMVQQLVKIITDPGPGETLEVIKLENANAVDVARMLDEWYNGVRPAAGDGGRRGGGGFPFPGGFPGGAAPAPGPAPARESRIRVVADPNINSLLLKAAPIDVLTIKKLIRDYIDVADPKSKQVVKNNFIKLTWANANDVAAVVRDLYRQSMDVSPIPGQAGSGRFGFAAAINPNIGRPVDVYGNPRPVALSVSVDDRTNTLLVQATQTLFEEIEKLAKQLDEAAQNPSRKVQIRSVRGIDPALVQQMVDAIQGRRTTNTSMPNVGFGGGGFGGLPGGGLGGTGGFGRPPGGFGGPGGGGAPGGGFGQPFGGGRGGGPGGGRPPGGGGLRPDDPERGRDFFGDRVKDDPRPLPLYDPQLDTTARTALRPDNLNDADRRGEPTPPAARQPENAPLNLAPIQPVRYQEEQQPPPPPPGGGGPGTLLIPGLSGPVNTDPLPQLGVIVVSGNEQDVKAILELISRLEEIGRLAEVGVALVPLEKGDATNIVNYLNQLFQRVTLTPAGATSLEVPRTTSTATPFGQLQTSTVQAASVALLALPRFNSILVAAPKGRLNDIVVEIKRLDREYSPQMRLTPFPMRHQSASKVATQIQTFWSQRFPGETANQHQVRLTYDDHSNTIYVQAGPADMKEIGELIERIDASESSAVNDLRIRLLRYIPADELASVIQTALSQGVVVSGVPSTGIVGGLGAAGGVGGALGAGGGAGGGIGGGLGGFGGGAGGALGAGGGVGGALGAAGGAGGALGAGGGARPAGTVGTTTGAGITTKTTTIRFVTSQGGRERVVESGLLEDIHLTPALRNNSVIISAPEKSMRLIMALIDDLDALRTAIVPKVTVYPLKNADASLTANLLQQILYGTGAAGAAGARPGGVPGTPGGLPGGVPGGAGRLPTTGVGGEVIGGVPLLDLRIAVDDRSNSLIISGPLELVAQVENLIARLDLTTPPTETRRSEVYSLRNASAADVANALNTLYSNALSVYSSVGMLSTYQEILQQVIVVPEPITNKLIINATPRYFEQILRLIEELDAQPPQVVIQVLIAEVDLSGTEQFGVEIGLQSPILFSRTVIPAYGPHGPGNLLGPNGTVNYAAATTGASLIPSGVAVNSSINPTTNLGFNFNNTSLPLGNNPVVGTGTVGFQGLSNLNVGRQDPNLGFGGFVFSAASDTFNLLIRALKQQGRIDILSRPQVTTLDNQTANILVGRSVPYSTGSNITGTGIVSNSISYRDTGVLMNVTPRISPDGRVLMRVQPEVSKVAQTSINLGNGLLAPEFDVQSVQTTVAANDGETVVIGGLISRTDTKSENKIPWIADLPYVGAAFRYRTQTKTKTELLVILTPRIVRSKWDADRILAEESRRMDWIVGDVYKTQGPTGLEPILPPAGGVDGHLPVPPALGGPGWTPSQPPAPVYPPPGYQWPPPGMVPPGGADVLPPPRQLPPEAQGQAPAGGPGLLRPLPPQGGPPAPAGPPLGDPTGRGTQPPFPGQATAPTNPRQEETRWTVYPTKQQ